MLTLLRPAISSFLLFASLYTGNAFAADINTKDTDFTDLILAGLGLMILLAYGIRKTKI